MSLGVPTVHHQVILLTFLVSLINKKFRNERGFARSLFNFDALSCQGSPQKCHTALQELLYICDI